MVVYLNRIDGIDDAMIAMTLTKRNWTREKEEAIRRTVVRCTDRFGRYVGLENPTVETDEMGYDYNKRLTTILKFAQDSHRPNGHINTGHITLISFIDFSFTVSGLHYAGVADFDSHAYRYHNRIIRTSSRAKANAYGAGEKSEYYMDKVLTLDEFVTIQNLHMPDSFEWRGRTYVRTVNGYVLEEYKDKQDVKRGLYPLCIPSDFIVRCNMLQFAHVWQQRNYHGHANPEVQQCVETMADKIAEFQPLFTKEVLDNIHQ